MLPEKLKVWINLFRPFTLIAPLIAVIFGVIAQLSYQGELYLFWQRWYDVFFASITLMAAQAIGQILNQTEDVEIDIANKKGYRPIPSGKISKDEARSIAWILAIFALRGFFTNIAFGTFISILIIFGVFYSLNPIRIKKRLWLNTGWLAISRGLLPLPAVWSIFGNPLDPTPWLIGSVIAIWVLAWQNAKDFNDVEGDREFGIMTPSVYHGQRTLASIMILLSGASFALLYIYIFLGLLPKSMYMLFILCIPTVWMIYKMLDKSVMKKLFGIENNDIWAGFYLTLGGFYVVLAISYLL
jgi:4-hydroxybenzoate polyprenyltransferase